MVISRRVMLSLLASAFVLAPLSAQARECAGVTMPNRVTVAGQSLVLNGMGIREATVFNVNVYVAGLYIPERSRDGAAIASADSPKQLVLQFVRDVDRDTMDEAIRDGFGSSASTHSAGIRRLTGMLPSTISSGTKITFTYVPGTGLQVKIGNRNRGTIEGLPFTRVFFGIWLGSNPPNRGLKRGLLGGSC